MKVLALIPARLASTRFPNKPLAQILEKSMLQHIVERVQLCKEIDQVAVATCDQEIIDHVQSLGHQAIMTSNLHERASDRCAEAVSKIEVAHKTNYDIVVMVQGDEPLFMPETIAETLAHFNDPTVEIVNIMSRIRTMEQFVDKNNVKVVVKQNNDALYFSREPIPSPWRGVANIPMYLQTGIIAFRREVLLRFNLMPETRLEQVESVDMNRVLETGGRIRMVLTEAITIGVDTPQELKDAEILMKNDPTLFQYLKK